MKDIWNKDPVAWRKLPLVDRLHAMRVWHCTGPCAQSHSVIGTREALNNALVNAISEISKADRFRSEVLAALIECQDYDRLYNQLMNLIERTAKNAND